MQNPETLHRDLTDIFLHEYEDGQSVHLHADEWPMRVPEKIPASQYLSISLGGTATKQIVARDMTPAFHEMYNDLSVEEGLRGGLKPAGEVTAAHLLETKLRGVRPEEDLRQKTLYFLQAHQGFFEINIREMVKDKNEEVEVERDRYMFHNFFIGIPRFAGSHSANTSYFSRDESDRPIIEARELPSADDLELIFKAAHQRAATQKLPKAIRGE